MPYHCFKIPGGKSVEAKNLSIGSKVVAVEGSEVDVTWCQVYPKEKKLVVDLHTKNYRLTVTGSHRIPLLHGGVKEAAALAKGEDVLVHTMTECEKLLKVTKRYDNCECVELEFATDVVIPVWTPSILTKGALPSMGAADACGSMRCKEEQEEMDDVAAGSCITPCGEQEEQEATIYPDTDDGF